MSPLPEVVFPVRFLRSVFHPIFDLDKMSSIKASATRSPGKGCLLNAVTFVFRDLDWRLFVASDAPFKIAVTADPVLDSFLTGTGFSSFQDLARSAVAKAVVRISSSASSQSVKFVLRALPTSRDACIDQRLLEHYRRLLKVRIRRMITEGGYEALTDPNYILKPPSAAVANKPVLNELDELLAGIEVTLPDDILAMDRSEADEERVPVEAEVEATFRRAVPLEPFEPVSLAPQSEPDTQHLSGKSLNAAVKFVFGTLKPTTRVVTQTPFCIRLMQNANIKAHIDGQRVQNERDRANTAIIRALDTLVKVTDRRTYLFLASSNRPPIVRTFTDPSDPMTRYLRELHACIEEAVRKGGEPGLQLLVEDGLKEHSKLFELDF